jgi:hypothetical protein
MSISRYFESGWWRLNGHNKGDDLVVSHPLDFEHAVRSLEFVARSTGEMAIDRR